MSLLMDALRQAEKGRAKDDDRDAAGGDARVEAPVTGPDPEPAPDVAATGSGEATAPESAGQPPADLSLAPLDSVQAAPEATDFDALAEADNGTAGSRPAAETQVAEAAPVVAAEPELTAEPESPVAPEEPVPPEPEPVAEPQPPAAPATGAGPAAGPSLEAPPERVQAERLVALARARTAAARRRMKLMLGGLGGVILLLLAGYGYLQMTSAGDAFAPRVAMPEVPDPEVEALNGAPQQAPVSLSGPTRLRPLAGPLADAASPAPAGVAAGDTAAANTAQAVPAASAQPSVASKPGAATGIRIRRVERPRPVDADLALAFEAFGRGDLATAAERYRQVLRREPGNRDARMGLGAVALRQGDTAAARAHYREVLRRDPSDTAALAALALIGGEEIEDAGRLEMQLQQHPEDARLHFALGTLHARAGRWAEAQRAYFEAHRLAPEQPEYAFNLAVALDHLGKPEAALEFYRRARVLADGRGVVFDRQALDRRIARLAGGAGS